MKKLKVVIIFAFLILLPVMILRLQNAKEAQAAWYSTTYNYRLPITLTNGGALTKENYDVLLTVDTSTPIAASRMQSDCDDIRPTDSDGTTVLSYDLESGCNTSTTKIWVRIPELGLTGKTIYLYYGNPGATNSETNYSGNYIMLSAGACQTGWSAVSALDNNFLYGSASYGATGGDATSSHTQASCTSGGPSGTEPNSSTTGATLSTKNHTHTLRRNITDNTSVLPPYLDMVICSKSAITSVLSGQIALFDTTTPTGWTRVTALDSNFPRGAASYGGTGGATTHTHSSSSGGSTTGATSTETGGGTGGVASHTHATGGSVGNGTHTPPYLDMVFASKDSDGDLLDGMIVMLDASPGLGWTQFTALDSKFPRGAATYGGTGGATTHSHTVSITANSSSSQSTSDGTGNTVSVSPHSHTGCNATSSSDSNLPTYTEVIYAKRIDNSADSVTATNGTAISAPELAGWWKLDEGVDNTCSGGSNDVCDGSTNTIDGANSGATWKTKDDCLSGSCLFFDGSDDVVTITNEDAIDFDIGLNSAFTIATWVRPNSDGEADVGQILQKGTTTYIRVTNEGTDGFADLEVSLDLATTDATATVTNGITLDHWHHIAVTYSDDGDDEISVYINGLLRGTSTNGVGSLASDANNLLLGGTTTANYHGFLDDTRILDVEKTAAEVKHLYDIYATARDNAASFGPDTSFLTDGLTAYWPMNETAADTCTGASNDNCDKSGNGFDLAWAGNTAATTGKFGSGTTYDGTGDSAACTDANCGGTNNLDFGAGDQLSFGGWFKNTSTSTEAYFGKKNNLAASTAGYIMQQTTSDTVRCIIADGTNIVQPASTSTYNDGNWHHAFCTVSKDYVSLYVDGVLVDQDPNTLTASLDNTDSFVVAESGAGTGDLTGQIDDLRVYRKALSEMEVANLYNWAPGPIGYWPMDENTGTSTTYDKSGNAYNGTLTSITESQWMPGRYGSSLDLDGAADYIDTSTDDPLDITGPITLSAWVYRDSISAIHHIISKNPNGADAPWQLALSTSGTVRFYTDGTAGETTDSTDTIPIGSWHHVAVVRNTSQLTFYIDGVQDSGGWQNYTAANVAASTVSAKIGARGDGGSNFFDGKLDEIKVYNYARSPSQVIEDMNGGHPIGGSPEGSQIIRYKFDELNQSTAHNYNSPQGPGVEDLISWWSLDETSGSALDSHLTANTLTETGGTIASSTTGKVFNARDFELADTEWFAITDNASLSMGDIAFTIGAWVNTESQAGIMQILSKFASTGDSREYRIYYNNTNDRFEFNVTPNGVSTGEATATADNYGAVPGSTWAFVVAYHDPVANTIGISVDNGTVNTTSYSSGVYDGGASFVIGAANTPAPTQYWDGLIDEAFVYKKVLSAKEIEWLYNNGNGRTYAHLETTNPELIGAISGATWKNGSDCKISGCLDFDGTDDVVTTTNTNAIDFDTNLASAVSFTAWINADSDGENDVGEIFDKGATTYCRTDSQGTTDLDLECSLDLGTTDATVNITDGLTTNTWHHIAMVYQDDADDEIEVYIDGILRGTSTNGVGSPATSDTNDLLIGGSTTANFDGTIDEFHLYNVPLTLAQVLIDRNANSQASLGGVLGATEKSTITGGAGNNPTGWWKMDENTGIASTYDSSGNNFTGTLTSITASSWVPGKLGSALSLDGTADFVDIGTGPSSVKTVSFWVYPETTTEYFVNLTSTTDYIWSDAGTVTATGFSTPTIYVNGVATTTLAAGSWQHVVVVTDTAENASNMDIGRTADTNYLQGKIDEVKMFDYALTPAQVAYEYNRGGPVGWWRMDEGTGTTTTYDASGKGYNLTLNGIAEGDWATGKFGSSITYDGVDDYAYCTDAGCGGTTKLDFGIAPAFSYGAWFKATATGTQQRIIGKKSTSAASAGYMLDTNTSNLARCKIADGTNNGAAIGTAGADGTWHHVMCVHTGSALYLYQDGVLTASDTDTSDVTLTLDNTSDFRLGTAGNDSDDLTGQVDDARVYNYALSAAQIRNIMNLGAQRFGE